MNLEVLGSVLEDVKWETFRGPKLEVAAAQVERLERLKEPLTYEYILPYLPLNMYPIRNTRLRNNRVVCSRLKHESVNFCARMRRVQ